MRFRTKQRPVGVLRTNDQRRMTLMIIGCGLVFVCFSFARRPEFWKGIFPDRTAAQAGKTSATKPAQRIPAGQQIAADEFLAGSAEVTDVTTRKIPFTELPGNPQSAQGELPRLPAELLRTVKDDVIGVHSTESDAYYAAMKLASKLSPEQLESAPSGAYALFMDSPEASRGVAYHLTGKLRQLSVVRHNATAFGLGGGLIYDAWMTTPDSGDKLVHVQAMKADESLGRQVERTNHERTIRFLNNDAPDVHFTGYFLKREAYASRRNVGVSTAPLFVSAGLYEVPVPVVTQTHADEITPYVAWMAFIISGGVLLMAWSFTMSDVAHSSTRAHQLTRLPVHASFEGVTSITIGEALNEMRVEADSEVS